MMYIYKRIRGRWRLKFGFCPLCNSSPPDNDCPVCHGSYAYGPKSIKITRETWKKRYLKVLKGRK